MGKFYWQERVWTCGPAALRIALFSLGIERSEKHLASLLNATQKFGVANRSFIKVAKKMNLDYRSGKGSLKLLNLLKDNKWQVIVNYFSVLHGSGHFAVVNKISEDRIYLLDPALGPGVTFTKDYFNKIWYSGYDNSQKWFIALRRK